MPYYFAGHASLSVISIIMIKIRQRKYTILVAVTVFAFQSFNEIGAELLHKLEDYKSIKPKRDMIGSFFTAARALAAAVM